MKSTAFNGYLQYLLIAVLAVAQYAQTAKFDYALDDSIFITQNGRVQQGLNNVPRLFENARTGKLEYKTGYRPVTLLSFATDIHFFGMDPKVSHTINILLYTGLCMLILFVLGMLFPQTKWMVFLVTILFTVHPLHVEVVANIKSRDELLAMLFSMFYLTLHLWYFRSNKVYYLFLAPLIFLFASLSKESAITFAGVSLGLALFMSSRTTIRAQVYSAISSVISIAVVLLMRLYVYSDQFFNDQRAELEELGKYHWDGFLGNPLFDVTDKLTAVANAFNIISHSVKMFLVPHPLVHDYSYNHFPVVDWSEPQVYVGLAIVLASTFFIIRGIRKGSAIAFGLLWFMATISIYLSLARPATDIFAERFLFAPSLGLCMVALGMLTAFKLNKKRTTMLVSVWSVGLLSLSYTRAPAWENTQTLLKTDIETLHDCVRANYNYALYLHQQYDTFPKQRKPGAEEKILLHYNRALDKSDRLANLYLALGNAYMRFKQPNKAIPVFKEGSVKYPHLSKLVVQLGNCYMSAQQYDSAAYYFSKSVEIGRTDSRNYMNLAMAQFLSQRQGAAIATMQRGEQYALNNPEFYHKFIAITVKSNELETAELVVFRGLSRYPKDTKLLKYKKQFQDRRKSLNARER